MADRIKQILRAVTKSKKLLTRIANRVFDRVVSWAPYFIIAYLFATAWLIHGQGELASRQAAENDRRIQQQAEQAEQDEAKLCVRSWQGRAEIREFVIDASRETAITSNLAILNTFRALSPNPERFDNNVELTLRSITEESLAPTLKYLSERYPDPTCDLAAAKRILEDH